MVSQFFYILPEMFVIFASLYIFVLGLISFTYFSVSPSGLFSWGRSWKYNLDLNRKLVNTQSSFFIVVFLSSFFLCIILYDFLDGSTTLFIVLFYGAYDISYFTSFAKLLVSIAFLFYLFTLHTYYAGNVNSKFYGFSMSFESFFLMFLALLASIFIVSSANFLSFYLSLELQTLILYVLVSMNRTSATSTEGGLKYLILGALSTGLLLFGISLFYGLTSLINFFEISIFFSLLKYSAGHLFAGLISISLIFIFFSFFFKFSIFPFHLWTPDVYEGSPTPIMVFIAVFGKFSILFLLIKLLLLLDLPNNIFTMGIIPSFIIDMFLFFSFVTVLVGSVGGLFQSKIKRLWGYSAITNLGFIFLGLSTFSVLGFSAAALYLSFYTLLNFIFFTFYTSVKFRTGFVWSDLRYLGQLGYSRVVSLPFYYTMCFVLVSFLSFPPLLNFIMKVYVLWAVYYDLTYPTVYPIILFLLVNLIASFYYLRLYRFFLVQSKDEYFYPPIFYKSVSYSSYFILFIFLVIYVLCLVYNNSIFSFFNLVFSSYASSPPMLHESLEMTNSGY